MQQSGNNRPEHSPAAPGVTYRESASHHMAPSGGRRGHTPINDQGRQLTVETRDLIHALGVRTVRIPDLPQRVILLTRYRMALIDADATDGEWDDLYDAILAKLPTLTA